LGITNENLKEKCEKLEFKISKLNEENHQLKEDYEKYRIKTNYLLKTAELVVKKVVYFLLKIRQFSSVFNCFYFCIHKPSKETEKVLNDSMSEKLQSELDAAKKRIILMEKERDDDIQKTKELCDKKINEIRLESKHKLDNCESERIKEINELEKELVKQRERSLKLISDKEAEIAYLKSQLNPIFKTENITDEQKVKSSNLEELNKVETSFKYDATTTDSNELNNIYLSQMNSYKETETTKLRKEKSELEYRLKQIADENSVETSRFQTQIGVLKDEIERLKLNEKRSELNGCNLEYIKNVVYNYLSAKDPTVKLNMMKAIAEILQFSKNEKHVLSKTQHFN